jgi:hypothetical protein
MMLSSIRIVSPLTFRILILKLNLVGRNIAISEEFESGLSMAQGVVNARRAEATSSDQSVHED